MKTAILTSICLLAAIGAGCSNDGPTSPTHAGGVGPTTTLFTGTLAMKGSAFFPYVASQAGRATAMLASLTVGGTGPAVVARVGLGMGTLSDSGCELLTSTSTTTTPALTPQVAYDLLPGAYCVIVFDTGTLESELTFAVRLVYP